MFFSWSRLFEGRKLLGFFSQWYAKESIFEIQDCKPLGTVWDFSQNYIELDTVGWRRATASFMIWKSWTIHQVPCFFFIGRIGVLHSKFVGTISPQAWSLFIRGCSPSWASLLRGYHFWFGNRVGSRRTVMTCWAWWAHPGVPWAHTWGLILSSHSFWSLPIGQNVMGS